MSRNLGSSSSEELRQPAAHVVAVRFRAVFENQNAQEQSRKTRRLLLSRDCLPRFLGFVAMSTAPSAHSGEAAL